jgi:hypothetical protein
MATNTLTATTTEQPHAPAQSQYPREPLQLKGVLDSYQSFDTTPVIGREFVDVNLKEWLRAPNSDDLIRDLAITSQHPYFYPQHLVLTVRNSLSTRSSLLPQAR